MTELDVRPITADEVEALYHSIGVPFLNTSVVEQLPEWIKYFDPSRSFAAFDQGRVVGNAVTMPLEITLPGFPGQGAPSAPVAAVTAVGVHPTHRRRGLLRRLMAAMLDDARRRGEPVAALYASEGTIYGRFGFGAATFAAEITVDTHHAAFAHPRPAGDFQLLDHAEAAKVLPELFEKTRRRRAGEISRDRGWWAERFEDRPGPNPKHPFTVVTDGGYVRYNPAEDERGTLNVFDLCAVDDDTEAALAQFVLQVDLIGAVRFHRRPLDDPLRWRLVDTRRWQTSRVEDQLWVRVLDVPAAFSRRGYARPGRLVFEVVRPLIEPQAGAEDPAVLGRWVLETDGASATARPAGAGDAVELRVPLDALGTLYLGGVSALTLTAAGRVEELRAGAARRADDLLAVTPAPFTTTNF